MAMIIIPNPSSRLNGQQGFGVLGTFICVLEAGIVYSVEQGSQHVAPFSMGGESRILRPFSLEKGDVAQRSSPAFYCPGIIHSFASCSSPSY